MNHVWSAPLFGRSTCFFLNYCILTWRNIIGTYIQSDTCLKLITKSNN